MHDNIYKYYTSSDSDFLEQIKIKLKKTYILNYKVIKYNIIYSMYFKSFNYIFIF